MIKPTKYIVHIQKLFPREEVNRSVYNDELVASTLLREELSPEEVMEIMRLVISLREYRK